MDTVDLPRRAASPPTTHTSARQWRFPLDPRSAKSTEERHRRIQRSHSWQPLRDRLLFLATGFRVGSHLLLLFSLLPTGIGVVFLHALGENFGFLTEIFLIHHSIHANDEGHHAG